VRGHAPIAADAAGTRRTPGTRRGDAGRQMWLEDVGDVDLKGSLRFERWSLNDFDGFNGVYITNSDYIQIFRQKF